MNNIALGRYLPLDSVIHRMDPRAKICAMLITMIAIFIPAGYSGYLVLGVIVCSIALMAKLQLSFVWRAMKPMLFMLVFLLVINLLVIHDGYVMLSIFIQSTMSRQDVRVAAKGLPVCAVIIFAVLLVTGADVCAWLLHTDWQGVLEHVLGTA